jgi:hypothetical protein
VDKKLYILEYRPDGDGCPYFMAEEGEPGAWEWDNQDPNPFGIRVTSSYALRITDHEIRFIDFDLYGTNLKYVSDQFIEVCDAFDVRFRPVPLDVTFWDGSRPQKKYSVFLPADHLPILDPERSIVEVERVAETGEPMGNRYFPQIPFYKKIEKFVVKDIGLPPLFQCVEINALVCGEEFRVAALNAGLRGLKFVPLDDSYSYDPWAGW